ncbi:IS1-like element transposase [Affinibrenneria salicis]|uniref:IS1-like element transposase n=1 Tax=Affinibrenneria salicis TaxID=2590031 RepID=UPI001CC39BA3
MVLTDAVAWQARTTGKAYTLNDNDGLSLFVTANGAKKWHFRFSLQGKQQRISLGFYPVFSLKQARQQRDELRAQLAAGNDPCSYEARKPGGKEQLVDMAFNGAGVRDAARTLQIGINTVIRTLKTFAPPDNVISGCPC